MNEQAIQEEPDVAEGKKIAKKLLKTYAFIGAACVVGGIAGGPVGVGVALGCVAAGYVTLGAIGVGYSAIRYGVNKAKGIVFKSKSRINEHRNTQKSLAQQYEHYEEVFAKMRQNQAVQSAGVQSGRAGQKAESTLEGKYKAQDFSEAKKSVNEKVSSKTNKVVESAKKIETRAFDFNGVTMGQGGRKF